MTFWLVVIAVVLVVVAIGYRYDRKHRRLGDAPTGSQMSRTGADNQGQAEEKSTRWNGMPFSGG
jgi:hypothetical protein